MAKGVTLLSSTDPQVTWNPSDKNANVSLSLSNLQASRVSTNAYGSVRATRGIAATGNGYFEVFVLNGPVTNFMLVGLSTTAMSTAGTASCGSDVNSWGYYQNTGQKVTGGTLSAYGATWATGDVLGVAFNNGKLWFAKNGVWQNSGNPAADTGAAFTGITGTIYPTASLQSVTSGGDKLVGRFMPRAFSYSPPSGFLPWEY